MRYHSIGMRFRSLGQFARPLPLVAAAFLLCFAVYLSPTPAPTGEEIPVAGHPSQVSPRAAGDGHVLGEDHPVAFAEEVETGGEQPVNAESLTALLLSVALIGTALGLLLQGRLILRRGALLPLFEQRLPSFPNFAAREPAGPLFSVFRL